MFKENVDYSNVLEFIYEETDEEAEVHRVFVRVPKGSRAAWETLIGHMLLTSHKAETFGLSVNQEFYLNDDQRPAIAWYVTFWGDLEEAKKVAGPLLGKRIGAPPPPKGVALASQKTTKRGRALGHVTRREGDVQVTRVPLPHKRKTAGKSQEETFRIGHDDFNKSRAVIGHTPAGGR